MKKIISGVLFLVMLISLTGCKKYESLYYSTDSLEEFYKVSGISDKTYYNVTPEKLAGKINLQIFKNNVSGESYILMGSEVYKICEGGSFGFIDAVDCDYDNNKKPDLLVSYNDKEGAKLVVFNAERKFFKNPIVVDDDDSFIIKKTKMISVDKGLSSVKVGGFAYNLTEIELKKPKDFSKLKYIEGERKGSVEITGQDLVLKED